MPVLDTEKRWRLADDATDEQKKLWHEAIQQPSDRKGNRERARALQRLWKNGGIVTRRASAT